MVVLCAEVVFSFMRFSSEAKSKWLIDENSKVALNMYEAIQKAATTYSEVTTKLIPSVLDRTWMVRCKGYTDLATATSHPITSEFPPLKEPPSTAFVSFASVSIDHQKVAQSKADGTVKGETVQFLMKALDDQSEGLQIQLQSKKLNSWTGNVCYLMLGTKKAAAKPAPPKRSRRLGKKALAD